jgi:hypothetical protein
VETLKIVGTIILIILVVVIPAIFVIGTAIMGKQADELSAVYASDQRQKKEEEATCQTKSEVKRA